MKREESSQENQAGITIAEDLPGRRDFLKNAAAGLMIMLTEGELRAFNSADDPPPPGPPVKIGVIGLGQWGKEILAALLRISFANVTAVCDTYENYLKKGQEVAIKAQATADYRRLLDSPEVEAVIVATPSHQHKEITLAALQANKHIYCEAPLATSIDDARAIAAAALQSPKLAFQTGLQGRSNGLYKHVLGFIKSGVLGTPIQATAQWNKRTSWRRAAPTPERERELNWRLSAKTSAGLLGEIGIHNLDLISWYLGSQPEAVTGFGSIKNWNDGRDIADTLHCIFEYPKNLRAFFTSTLASSFSDSFTLFQGTNSSLLLREKRGWMIKEADSPLLGWEVYARKEPVHSETGICLVADATKLVAAGKEPGKEGAIELAQEPLQQALEGFCRAVRTGVKAACGPIEGYQATVAAIKANESVAAGNRLAYDKSWLEIK